MRPALQSPELREWTFSDGYVASGRVWSPSAKPAQAVLYLHGIESHGGWFERSASLIAGQRCAVILPDRRGSGMNSLSRGDTPTATRWLEDLDELIQWVQQQFGIERIGMVGVSWGGKLAARWALRNCDRVTKLLLITPGLFPLIGPPPGMRLRVAGSLLSGGKKQFAIPLEDPTLFTDNPDAQRFIRNDSLRLHEATARFFYHSFRIDRTLRRAEPRSLRVPTTLFTAGHDRIIRSDLTKNWLRHVCATPPAVFEFPNDAHTLEFAGDPSRFDETIADWTQRSR